MKLLFYTHHYRPEPIGIGAYTAEMCEWLAGRKHQVRVVAPPPHYPEWAVRPPYSQWKYQSEELGGVRVFRCPLWVPFNPRGWQRVLSQLLFVAGSFPVMVLEMCRRPDVAFVVEPGFLNAVACLLIAKCFKTVSWLHIQDFEIDIAFKLGQFSNGRLRRWAGQFETWIMGRFDVVSTISGRMCNALEGKGVDPARTVLFPNWVDTGRIFPLNRESPFRAEFGIPPGKLVALFSGTLGTKQGVDLLLETAALLQTSAPDIEFVICGNGPAVPPLKNKAQGLTNVRFFPLQPQSRLNDLLSLADVHLLPQKLEVADLVMPSKLINMVASGRPVVASARAGTEIANVVSRCGVLVEAESAPAMAGAILELARNEGRRLQLGRAARDFALLNLRGEAILGDFEKRLYHFTRNAVQLDTVSAPPDPL